MAPGRRRGPARFGLFLLLVMAAGFGVLAALLSSGVTSTFTPGPTPSAANSQPYAWWAWLYTIAGYVAFAAFALYVVYQVYVRIARGRMPLPVRFAIVGFSAILIGVLFVAAFHLAHSALTGGTATPRNDTGGGGQGTIPPNLTANGTGGLPPGGSPPFPSFPQLTWLDIGLAAIFVALLVAGLIVARMRPESDDGRPPDTAAAARIRDELLESLRRLEEDPDADPREVILAVYHRLLLVLGRRMHTTEPYTPREIALVLVTEFGVKGENSEELTRMFEVARYSTHPLGRPEAERARRAFRTILDDLQPVGLTEPPRAAAPPAAVTVPPRSPPPA